MAYELRREAIPLSNLNNDNIFYEAREIPIESNFSQEELWNLK